MENLFEIVSQYFYNKEYGLSFIAIVSLLLCSLYTLKRYNEWLKFIIIFWVALISFIGYLFLKLLGTNLSSWLNISLYVILFCILSFVVFYCVFLINKFFSRSNRTKIKDARKTSTSEQNADNAKISESENYDKLVGLAFKSLCFSLVFGFIFTIIISFISNVSFKSLVLKCVFMLIELFITSILLVAIMGFVQTQIQNDSDIVSKKIIKLIAGCFMVYVIVICFDNVVQNTVLSPTYSVQLVQKNRKDKISSKNLLKNIKDGKAELEIVQNK